MNQVAALDELVGLYVLKRFGGKPELYQADIRSKLRPLITFFGAPRNINSLAALDMQAFIEWMAATRKKRRGSVVVAEPLSPFTINSRIRNIRSMFNWAVRQGHVVTNPLDDVKTPRTPAKLPAAVAQADVEFLLGALKQDVPWLWARNVALIYCLRDTGARVGGLCAAKVTDLEPERYQLLVTEKGEKSRYVFMTAITLEKLRVYLGERHEFWGRRCSDALFIGRDGGSILPGGVAEMLTAAALRCDLRGRINPHAFRHAFARDMLRAGCDLSQVSQMMGHSGIQVTADYYARWDVRELRAAHRKNSPAHAMPGGSE